MIEQMLIVAFRNVEASKVLYEAVASGCRLANGNEVPLLRWMIVVFVVSIGDVHA